MLIGLTGPSGSRKTATSRYLQKQHGFERLHAGKPVKDAAKAFGLGKNHTDEDGRDRPTALLGGAAPRDLMEAIGHAVSTATPHAIPAHLMRRVAQRLTKGRSVVVDGVRSPEQSKVLTDMGARMVRTDNGQPVDETKPMDRRAAMIKTEYTLDTSGKKPARRAAVDRMLQDMRG